MDRIDNALQSILEEAKAIEDRDQRISFLGRTITRVDDDVIFPELGIIERSELIWELKEEIWRIADAQEALHGNHALRLRVGSPSRFVLHEYVAPWGTKPYIFCKILEPDEEGAPVDRRDEISHDTYYYPEGVNFPPYKPEKEGRNYSLCKPLNDEEVSRLEQLVQAGSNDSRQKVFYSHLLNLYHQWYQAHEQPWPDLLANREENEERVSETQRDDQRINVLFYIQNSQTVEQSEGQTNPEEPDYQSRCSEDGVWKYEAGRIIWYHKNLLWLACVLTELNPCVPIEFHRSQRAYVDYFVRWFDVVGKKWDTVRKQYSNLIDGRAELLLYEEEYLRKQAIIIRNCLDLDSAESTE